MKLLLACSEHPLHSLLLSQTSRSSPFSIPWCCTTTCVYIYPIIIQLKKQHLTFCIICPLYVQLQHTLTKKFVAVNTTVTSRTENTSLRVELSAVNTSGCIFKILPIYKVHSVGDEVRFELQFVEDKIYCISKEYNNIILTIVHRL